MLALQQRACRPFGGSDIAGLAQPLTALKQALGRVSQRMGKGVFVNQKSTMPEPTIRVLLRHRPIQITNGRLAILVLICIPVPQATPSRRGYQLPFLH